MKSQNKILVFEISSNFGHFRKYFTTSSPISYSFPSRTTIIGIIAAMLGKDRDSYYEEFSEQNLNIALEIINPIRKVKFSTNYINTQTLDKNYFFKNRTQIPCQYIKNPKYRIYLNLNNKNLYESLKMRLENIDFHYSVSLGQAQHLAKVNYLGEFSFKEESKEDIILISSVLRKDFLKELKFEFKDGKIAEYLVDRLLVDFESNFSRKPKLFRDYLYEKNGENSNGILCKLKNNFIKIILSKDNIKNVVFL